MIIFLDMDGVLADFDKYVCETHKFGTKEEFDTALKAMPKNVDWSKLGDYEAQDYTAGAQTAACAAGGCEVVDL